MSILTVKIREQMRHGENYIRPESGVLRFCIAPLDLNSLLRELEAREDSSKRIAEAITDAIELPI